jgi:CRISPR-associated protein Cas1
VEEQLKMLHICREKVSYCNSINELIGFEGQGAKAYFDGLSQLINPQFKFHGRSRRPPMDEFNSMISLGYSVIMNEVYSKIEEKGLNPYFGFMHRDKENHPTLASDMMEEWRAVIVDATVMSMINGHEIQKDDFTFNLDEPGCFLTKNGIKLYLSKLEKKLQTEVRYLDYVDYPVSFRRGIALQMDTLAKAIDNEDATLYNPIEIR